jgi:hypothetical protein
MND